MHRAFLMHRSRAPVGSDDKEHSESAERWATIGNAQNRQLLVAIHAFGHTSPTDVAISVISARKATKREVRDYEPTPR